MIELNVKSSYCNTKFHFHTMEDCKKFLYVFKNHWCNVPWGEPEIVPDSTKLSEYEKSAINKDPKIRAEEHLGWGFQLAKFLGTDTLTEEQNQFLKDFTQKI